MDVIPDWGDDPADSVMSPTVSRLRDRSLCRFPSGTPVDRVTAGFSPRGCRGLTRFSFPTGYFWREFDFVRAPSRPSFRFTEPRP